MYVESVEQYRDLKFVVENNKREDVTLRKNKQTIAGRRFRKKRENHLFVS